MHSFVVVGGLAENTEKGDLSTLRPSNETEKFSSTDLGAPVIQKPHGHTRDQTFFVARQTPILVSAIFWFLPLCPELARAGTLPAAGE